MSSITIHEATAADATRIAAIYGHEVLHGTATWEYDPPDVPEITRRMEAILAAGYPYLVAEDSGLVIGYAYASSYRARIGYRYTVENSVYIDRAAHGQGIGKALMIELIARCEALGFRQMVAVIGDSENHASIALHTSVGFRHMGTLPALGYKFDRWLDFVAMQRALGPGDGEPGGQVPGAI